VKGLSPLYRVMPQLPDRPNLEHLRNEAKQRLKELRDCQRIFRAARDGDLDTVRRALERGFHATCLGRVREDVAAYLLSKGARLNLWTAIALDRGDEVRRLIERDPARLTARMSRNEHRRTALHHAAAANRPDLAERMLREDPTRIGPDGRDTIALHLLVAKKNAAGARWIGWAEYCAQPRIAELLRERGVT
jgi:ankyrin repeat protein